MPCISSQWQVYFLSVYQSFVGRMEAVASPRARRLSREFTAAYLIRWRSFPTVIDVMRTFISSFRIFLIGFSSAAEASLLIDSHAEDFFF